MIFLVVPCVAVTTIFAVQGALAAFGPLGALIILPAFIVAGFAGKGAA